MGIFLLYYFQQIARVLLAQKLYEYQIIEYFYLGTFSVGYLFYLRHYTQDQQWITQYFPVVDSLLIDTFL